MKATIELVKRLQDTSEHKTILFKLLCDILRARREDEDKVKELRQIEEGWEAQPRQSFKMLGTFVMRYGIVPMGAIEV